MSEPASALPQVVDRDAPIFVISVAAQLAGLHPQTLRTYDRMGLVSPRRASGRGRRYSPRDVAKLRLVQRLSQEEGVNLEGIRRILAMEAEMETLREQVAQLSELLRQAHAAPGGPRTFTADSGGRVHMGRQQYLRVPRALPARWAAAAAFRTAHPPPCRRPIFR